MIDYTHRHTWIHLDTDIQMGHKPIHMDTHTETHTDIYRHTAKHGYTDRHRFASNLRERMEGDS